MAEDGKHTARIGFGKRKAYGKERIRVVIWIDNYPYVEFLGADDFNKSGDVLSEIKVLKNGSRRICRYPEEPIPERYTMFNTIGMPVRINTPGVHNTWAIVANIADHKTMIALAGLRMFERE